MSVPTQRGQEDPSISGMILDTVRQVQASVDKLADRMDGLGERFMPRTELMGRFEDSQRDRTDLHAQLDKARIQHDADIAALETKHTADLAATRIQIEAVEEQRHTDRRFAITVAISLVGLFLTLFGILAAVIFQ